MIERLKKILTEANINGIPIPLFRDPMTGKAGVSFTAFSISFIVVLLGLLNKIVQVVKGFDMPNAMSLLEMMSYLYFGRSTMKYIETAMKSKENK